MQELWLRELTWDDELPIALAEKWQSFLQSFPEINKIRIPRWLQTCPKAKEQIRGFCDASQRAYGAAIYVCRDASRNNMRFPCGKDTSCPVKTATTFGAVVLVDLAAAIVSNFHSTPPKSISG